MRYTYHGYNGVFNNCCNIVKKCLLLLILTFLATAALGFADQSPPPANEVFQFSARLAKANVVVVDWQIAPGYYLYRDRIHFKLIAPKTAQLGRIHLPPGRKKQDEVLGQYQVFSGPLTIPVPLLQVGRGQAQLEVSYQGCAEDNYCYPPEVRTVNINFASNMLTLAAPKAVAPPTQQSRIEQLLDGHHFLLTLAAFLGFGFLLALTPCVLPMIPILSSIIVGQREKITTGKALRLSLAYVLGMALTYAALGVVVTLVGANIQIALQKPWVIILFSLIFVLLALSLFGLYELQLPKSWQAGLAKLSHRQRSGHYLGVLVMGVLATLIVSPCVTPPLVGALAYISQTGNLFLGGSALFTLGLGMGLPLILIGTLGGKFLPKVGAWMNAVKATFGVLLLAVAIWMLARVFSGPVILVLWAVLLIISAVFMGIFTRNGSLSGWQKLWKGLGVVFLIYGIILLIGASRGADNPLQPLAGLRTTAFLTPQIRYQKITNLTELKTALTRAQAAKKPVMLDFYADWCVSCKEMERTTFKDPKVIQALHQFVVLKADVTANNADDKALMHQFGVVAPPTFVFFNRTGQYLPERTLVGEVDTKSFLPQLQTIVQ